MVMGEKYNPIKKLNKYSLWGHYQDPFKDTLFSPWCIGRVPVSLHGLRFFVKNYTF